MKILDWKNGTYSFVWPEIPFVLAGDKLLKLCIEQFTNGNSLESIKNKLIYETSFSEEEVTNFLIEIESAISFANNYKCSETSYPENKQSMFTLNLTRKCNLNCNHCYAGGGKFESEMSKDEIEYVIDYMASRLVLPKLMIITGGEPTLEIEKLKHAIRCGRKHGFKIRVNSNGILLTNELAKIFHENEVMVQLSLDGIDAETHALLRNNLNSYTAVIEAIKILKINNVKFALSFTIHSKNLNQLPMIIDFALIEGAEKLNTSSLVNIGNAKINNLKTVEYINEFKLLYDSVKCDKAKQHLTRATLFAETVIAIRNGIKFTQCGTGNCTSCIDADGLIYPCLNLMSPSYLIADVSKGNLDNQFNTSKIKEALVNIDIDTLNLKCSSCFFKYWCGGFCRGETVANGGKLSDPYIRCGSWKKGLLFILKCLAETPDLYEGEELYE